LPRDPVDMPRMPADPSGGPKYGTPPSGYGSPGEEHRDDNDGGLPPLHELEPDFPLEYNRRINTRIIMHAPGEGEHADRRYPSQYPRHVVVPQEIGEHRSIEHRLANWGQYPRPHNRPCEYDIYHPLWRRFQSRSAHPSQIPCYPIDRFFQAGWYSGVLFDDVYDVDPSFCDAAWDWFDRRDGGLDRIEDEDDGVPQFIQWLRREHPEWVRKWRTRHTCNWGRTHNGTLFRDVILRHKEYCAWSLYCEDYGSIHRATLGRLAKYVRVRLMDDPRILDGDNGREYDPGLGYRLVTFVKMMNNASAGKGGAIDPGGNIVLPYPAGVPQLVCTTPAAVAAEQS